MSEETDQQLLYIANRRINLLNLQMPELLFRGDEEAEIESDLREACADAKQVGVYAAQIAVYLGLPRKFDAWHYLHYVIEPMYGAGCCGGGLHDCWVAKLKTAKGRKDPRVVAFVKAANSAEQLSEEHYVDAN